MDDLLRLDGRIVVVSGAGGGGIGTTITRMAAEAGATVVAVSRSKENLDEHVAPLAEQGLSVVPVSADASTDDGRRRGASTRCGAPTAISTAWSTSRAVRRRRRGCPRRG